MNLNLACALVEKITYKKGWSFEAVPYPRYDGTIQVFVKYQVQDSDKRYAPDYPVTAHPGKDALVMVSDCETSADLYAKIFDVVQRIEEHESREFFGVGPDDYRVFHPHTDDGMVNWSQRRPVIPTENLINESVLIFSG